MVIYTQNKFNEIRSIANIGMTEGWINNSNLSNKRAITLDILTKLSVRNHTMVINTQYEFHEIPSIAYYVMAEDRKKTLLFKV